MTVPGNARASTQERGSLRFQLERCLLQILPNATEKLDWNKPFREYGLDSLAAVGFAADLEDALGLQVSPTAFWDHPTLAALAEYLETQLATSPDPRAP